MVAEYFHTKKEVTLSESKKMAQKENYIILFACLIMCAFVGSTEEDYKKLAAKYAGLLNNIS